jgi:hypothetical protein
MGRNESFILLRKYYHTLNFMPVELAARRASAVLWSRDASTDRLFRVKLPYNARHVEVDQQERSTSRNADKNEAADWRSVSRTEAL